MSGHQEFICQACYRPMDTPGPHRSSRLIHNLLLLGAWTGGFGPESVINNGSHSIYHALQTSVTQNQSRIGLSFQASYTFSKSLDDTSAIIGGPPVNSVTILQAPPQNPLDPGADRGTSTFDVTHVFTLSAIQSVPLEKVKFLQRVNRKLTAGW